MPARLSCRRRGVLLPAGHATTTRNTFTIETPPLRSAVDNPSSRPCTAGKLNSGQPARPGERTGVCRDRDPGLATKAEQQPQRRRLPAAETTGATAADPAVGAGGRISCFRACSIGPSRLDGRVDFPRVLRDLVNRERTGLAAVHGPAIPWGMPGKVIPVIAGFFSASQPVHQPLNRNVGRPRT